MPKIERWEDFPEGVRRHLIERMRDRAISVADLNQLRLWIETQPQAPEGRNWKGSKDQSERLASTTSRWPLKRIGRAAPAPRSRTTRLPFRGAGASTWISFSGNPASRNRADRFGGPGVVAGGIGGIDFDELFEDVASELAIRQLGGERPEREQSRATSPHTSC